MRAGERHTGEGEADGPPGDVREELARAWTAPATRRRLVAFARRFVSHQTDAEDVAQETLTRALDRLPTLRVPERGEAWLLRICRHAAIDHARGRAVRRHLWGALPEDAERWVPAGEQTAPGEAPRRHLDLRVLPAHQRLLMSLHYERGLSQGRLCRMTGLSASALRVRLFRARAVLAESLRTAEPGPR